MSIVARLLGAVVVALTGFLPEGVSPADTGEAFSMAILLAVYGIVHLLAEKLGATNKDSGNGV